MKNYCLLLFAAIGLLLSSCQKEMTVTIKQSGGLAFTLQDSDGNAIPDKVVYLYSYYYSEYNNSSIDSKIADDNGKVSFGELLSGSYYVVVGDLEVDGKNYNINQYVQVTSGNNLDLVLNPEEYVGTVDFNAYSHVNSSNGYEDSPLSGITALAISVEDLQKYNDIDEYIDRVLSKGVTSSEGSVVLEAIPTNEPFRIIYFDEKEDWRYYSDYSDISLSKNAIYKCDVYYSYFDITVNLEDYSGLENVASKLLLIKDADFDYNMSLTQLTSVAYKSGSVYGSGQVNINNIPGDQYYLVAYKQGSNYFNPENIRVGEYDTEFYIGVWYAK